MSSTRPATPASIARSPSRSLPPTSSFDPERQAALRTGGQGRQRPQSPEHRHSPRHPVRRRDRLHRHGVRLTGRTLAQVIPAKGLSVTRGLGMPCRLPMPSRRARSRHRSPRPEAVERDGDRRRSRQGARLRAREAARAGPRDSRTRHVAGDQAGMVVGTAAYMSPEQAQGQHGRRAVGHLQLRRGALRDGHRPAGRLRGTRSCRCWRRFSTMTPRRRAGLS